ncbi:MAG: alkaline phosphatase family protein, partial [Nitrospirota bacterium]
EQFKGVMVTGMPTPNCDQGFVSPENLREEVLGVIGGKKLGVDVNNFLRGDETEFLKDLEDVTERTAKLGLHLISTLNWDFFMVVFDDLDRLQHVFWHHMDPQHPFYDERKARTYRDVILHFYQFLERQIEAFLPFVDDDTVLFVFSDHGMGPVYRNFYINKFFMERGWLKIRKQAIDTKKILRHSGLSFERIKLFLNRTKLQALIHRVVPSGLRAMIRKGLPADSIEFEVVDWSGILDWDDTSAYFCSKTGRGILINRAKVGDYEKFRDEVIQTLESVKDPGTGKCVINKVYRREEVYSGPCVVNAPDLLVEPAETYELQEAAGKEIFETINMNRIPISAKHHKEGILMVYGKQCLREGVRISDVKLVDIAPTILHILGLPVPHEIDGRVITEAISEEVLRNNPVEYGDIPLQMGRGGAISREDEAAIVTQLRGMGYMD